MRLLMHYRIICPTNIAILCSRRADKVLLGHTLLLNANIDKAKFKRQNFTKLRILINTEINFCNFDHFYRICGNFYPILLSV